MGGDPAATFCATLVDEWARAGLTDAAVSPGSRSTPMALALDAQPRVEVHVFLDERSAAFFALGVGSRTGRPAVVLTTSGTAAAELHPAVVEAHHADVPLLAVTADRPPEDHGVGAPQTIEQAGLYGGAVRWELDPGVPDPAVAHTWRSLAARAHAEACGAGGRPGPVHLNLAFREPLDGRPGPLPPGRRDGLPWHRATPVAEAVAAGVEELASRLSGRRGLVVADGDTGDPRPVHRLATELGWPVLAGARSPCRLPEPATVVAFDALLRHGPFAHRARPEVVLRLGSPPVSRVLAAWLATGGAEEMVVGASGGWRDPSRSAAEVVMADPATVCAAIARRRPRPAPRRWAALWAEAERSAQRAIDRVVAGHAEVTEPGVARSLVSCLPAGSGLVVASSMPIRDVELCARPRDGIRIMANRGTNGIDGTVATVLGAAARHPRSTVGLLGDLAFLHDAGALVGSAGRRLDAVLVVIDNQGGGIFSFLPQARSVPAPQFERLLATPHGVDLPGLVRAHGLEAQEMTEGVDLGPAVTAALGRGGVSVVVVRTDRSRNVAVHEELHAAVADALTRAPRASVSGRN
ncbi:MAG TPA: 2-succinyl-5-enolpyruvyl-6-hydroxy-3-cyclohexene-1-carboxylic-acid synthase [Acidimicrobiales bacterium]|nr:2-succinyl-5-enolpyruvyl-6-hydroxy-3-cyclohexene-1-carboxylic-acid synthase [Acidimicrobiales bacterium]